MATSTATPPEAMVEVGASAATDVTGFGLLGHVHEWPRRARVCSTRAGRVPVFEAGAGLRAEAVIRTQYD